MHSRICRAVSAKSFFPPHFIRRGSDECERTVFTTIKKRKKIKKITIQRHGCTRDSTYYAHPLPPRPPLLYHDIKRASALFLRKISPIRAVVHCFCFTTLSTRKNPMQVCMTTGSLMEGRGARLGWCRGWICTTGRWEARTVADVFDTCRGTLWWWWCREASHVLIRLGGAPATGHRTSHQIHASCRV